MCPLTYLPSPLTRILFPRLNRLLLGKFLIISLIVGVEFWRDCSSPYKLSRMLLLVFIGFGMSEQCLLNTRGSAASYFLEQ